MPFDSTPIFEAPRGGARTRGSNDAKKRVDPVAINIAVVSASGKGLSTKPLIFQFANGEKDSNGNYMLQCLCNKSANWRQYMDKDGTKQLAFGCLTKQCGFSGGGPSANAIKTCLDSMIEEGLVCMKVRYCATHSGAMVNPAKPSGALSSSLCMMYCPVFGCIDTRSMTVKEVFCRPEAGVILADVDDGKLWKAIIARGFMPVLIDATKDKHPTVEALYEIFGGDDNENIAAAASGDEQTTTAAAATVKKVRAPRAPRTFCGVKETTMKKSSTTTKKASTTKKAAAVAVAPEDEEEEATAGSDDTSDDETVAAGNAAAPKE